MNEMLEMLIERAVPRSAAQGDWTDVLTRAGVAQGEPLTEVARARTSPHRSPRRRETILGFAAASALAAAIAGVFLINLGANNASAATVRARIAHALAAVDSMSGEFDVAVRTRDPNHPWGTIASSFVLGADGSFAERSKTSAAVYDASTGVESIYEKTWSTNGVASESFVTETGLDPASLIFTTGEGQLAAGVQQALASQSPDVADTTFGGRPAWKLTLSFPPGTELDAAYGAKVDVTVDRETGMILQVIRYQNGTSPSMIETVKDLRLGVTSSPADFQLAKPTGAQSSTRDFGFRRMTVSQAASRVGYDVFMPTKAESASLTDLAVATTSDPRNGGASDSLPIYHDAVSARFGKGLDSFVISSRRGDASELPDLYHGISDSLAVPHLVKLSGGILAGQTAYVSAWPTQRTYVWTSYKGLIVQVMSPAGEANAVGVANSLVSRR